MPGGGDSVGGSIREKYDRGGPNIPGKSERTVTVRGLREIEGGGIVGVPQDDTAWAGGRGAMDLGSLGQGRRNADISDGLPDQGRVAELSSGGLLRTSRDKNGDADALLQPACPGYHDHLVGGKPPAETLGDPYHKQVPLPSIPAYRAR